MHLYVLIATFMHRYTPLTTDKDRYANQARRYVLKIKYFFSHNIRILQGRETKAVSIDDYAASISDIHQRSRQGFDKDRKHIQAPGRSAKGCRVWRPPPISGGK